MARKKAEVTITADGRDQGKVFILTEMPADQAEKLAVKVFLALSRSGVDLPEEVKGQGIVGLAVLGLKVLTMVKAEDAFEIMDEMFSCVQFRPDPSNVGYSRAPMPEDIEEVATRFSLRADIWKLHVGFTFAETVSRWTSA